MIVGNKRYKNGEFTNQQVERSFIHSWERAFENESIKPNSKEYKKNSQALQKELLRQDAKDFYGFMLIIFSPLIVGCFLGLYIGWIIWG